MNYKKTFLSAIFFVVILVITHFIGWLQPVEASVRSVVNPISKQIFTLSVETKKILGSHSETEKLREENKKLKEKLTKNKVKQAKLKQTKQENNQLKKTLNFFKEKKYESVGAEVIGKSIQQTNETMVLDKGSSAEIEVGDPVIVLGGVLIGKIAEVNENTAILRLLHDNQSKVAGMTLKKEESIGLAEGGFGVNVTLNYIPQNENIKIGETVITSGLSDQVPKGLTIGTIEAVEEEPYQPFRRAIIEPMVDLDKITLVSIITSVN